MTNKEKWMEYMSSIISPTNYIEWTWRYIIAASLQRRVWLPPDDHKCFANQYTIFVGKAGLGKGLCIREAIDFLSFWKQKDAIKLHVNGDFKLTAENQALVETIHAANIKAAQENVQQPNNKQAGIADPLLIRLAPDATTYEALVQSVSENYSRINYIYYNEKLQKNDIGTYGHSSLCFTLQELASLLRKRTEDTVNYMLGLYDCPDDYKYKTKTQGMDTVRKGCLNLLAGTTPEFMQDIFNAKLIDQGFGSRTFFIYADKNRSKDDFFLADRTLAQKQLRLELLDHIRKLTSLYGRVEVDDKVRNFLNDWWRGYTPKNLHPKMAGYYSRKKVHVMKTAMANHFSESTDLYVPVETYQSAIEDTDKEEQTMHYALIMESSDNPCQNIANKILEMLEGGEKNWVDIYCVTFTLGNQDQIQEALSFLVDTNKIAVDMRRDETTDKTIQYWRKI